MKRKAFGLVGIFLVIFQLFSPWMVSFDHRRLKLDKNLAYAQTRTFVSAVTKDAFLIITGIEDKKSISVSLFTSPNHKITSIDKIDFISDEKDDREAGCQADTITLVSNPSLSSPSKTSIAGLNLKNTQSNIYLKQDFVFSIPNTFTAACVDDNFGSDAWGHYKFYYKYEDRQGNKITASEPTNTQQSVEKISEEIREGDQVGTGFIWAQKGTGNSIDVKFGRIYTRDQSPTLLTSNGTGNLEINGSTTENIRYNIQSQQQEEIKVNFLGDNTEKTLYLVSEITSFDTTKILPSADGYNIKLNNPATFNRNIATLLFNPKTTSGPFSSSNILNSSTQQKIQNFFNQADWEFRDYSIIENNTKPALNKDGKPVLDVEISLYISKYEGKDFEEYQDIGTEKGKVDSKDEPNDWSSFMEDGSKAIDTRKAEDRDGFTLVYSKTEQDPEVDKKDGDINLNEYIFGAITPFTPVILGKDGMTFVVSIPIDPADFGKIYYLRLYARDNDVGSQDDTGYTKTISFTIPNEAEFYKTAQSSRNGEVTQEGEDLNNTGPAFLPKCGFEPLASGSLTGCLIQIFYWLVFQPTSYLLSVAGGVLDFILGYTIKSDAYKAEYIVDSWRFIRDVCNLFFIFMLIYLAFKMMLGIGQGVKQSIVNTLIVATVINFSYPLTTVVIDASNITARQLYYNAFNRTGDDGKPLSLSAAAAKGYNPQKIILEGLEKNQTQADENKSTIFMILLMGVIFNVIAIIMFLKLALQFVYRTIGLIFAIILSPLAVFSFSLSPDQRSKLKMVGFDEWMSGLLTDAFKAPVFLFLVMVLILFVNNNPFQAAFGDSISTTEWWASLIIPFMIVVAFFKIITSITKSMTSQIAELAGGAVIKGLGAIAGVAMGGAALAGSGIIGKGMGKLAESKMGQRIMDRSVNGKGLSSFIAKQQVKAMRAMQGGSYDLRQTGVMNAVSKESGANFNAGTNIIDKGLKVVGAGAIGLSTGMTAGGYLARGDRRNKEREEYLKLVQYNKGLVDKLQDKKEGIEDKKEDTEKLIQNLKDEHKRDKEPKEADLRDAKSKLRDKEAELKIKEKNKNDTDDIVKAIYELEDLLAKREDLISRGLATAEIDNKITRQKDKVIANASPTESAALTGAITAAGGSLNRTMLTGVKDEAEANKISTKGELDTAKRELNTAKNEVNRIEDEIKNLDNTLQASLRPLEGDLKDYNSALKEINKAIENVKNSRANAYAHQIRNKSGKIYRRKTYGQEMDGTIRTLDPEEVSAFDTTHGGENITEEMKAIVTNVEERSNTPNNKRSARVILTNTLIGGAAGVLTGGASEVALGAAGGGVVGVARTYRPENQSFRSSTDGDRWRPAGQDTYTPPSNS